MFKIIYFILIFTFYSLAQFNGSGFNSGSTGHSALSGDPDSVLISKPVHVSNANVTVTGTGLIGVGTNDPGAHPDEADDLVISGSGNTGLTIKSGTGSIGSIYMADAASGGAALDGYLQYLQNTRVWRIGIAQGDRVYINQNGGMSLSNSATSPASGISLDLQNPNHAMVVNRVSTATRTGLTAVNGMICYDTDLNAFYFYENGAWVTK